MATTGSATTTFNAEEFLDSRPLGWGHVVSVVVLMLVMLVDGYDLFVAGALTPAIAEAWHVKPSALTMVIVAQQAGLLAGVLFVGPLSDRYGRRRMLMICLACFGFFTVLAGLTHSPSQLMIVRFVSAIFFSGALPNCVALTAELAPKRLVAGLIGIVFCGYTGGSFVTAFVLAFMLKPFGWQGGFYLGGALALLMVPVVLVALPESIRFLVSRNPGDPKIGENLRKIDPSLELSGTESFVLATAPVARPRVPLTALMSDGMFRITMLIWISYFLSFFTLQMMNNWETTVFHNVGHVPYARIALLLSIRTTTGIIGTATAGFLMDRFGAGRALPLFYVSSAALLAMGLAFADLNSSLALVIFGVLGYTINSGIGGLNALAAISYPSRIRVTGIAWGSGFGRIGGMLGPLLGGILLAGALESRQFFTTVAVPEILAGISIWFIGRPSRRTAIGAPSRSVS
jgi:AAHS family 4-hydroxybenzoate transporter-like MFS transporter